VKRRYGLIVALDVIEPEQAISIANQIKEYIDAIKVSIPSVVLPLARNKINIISRLREVTGLPVIADWKVADVPHMDSMIVDVLGKLGATAVIVHGFMGEDAVSSCVKTAESYCMETFVVVELSSPGAVRVMQPLGEELALLARGCGASGIIAPATRPERVQQYRKIVGEEMMILSPGVGAQGGIPGCAIRAGADFEIVGRSIVNSDNPAEQARRISLETQRAINERTGAQET